MSDAQFAHSTKLRIHDGVEYKSVVELTNVSGPSISADEIDVSSHDSWKHAPAIDECTFSEVDNTVTAGGHGLRDGERIRFSTTDTLPAELSDDRWYYVTNKTDDDFQVEKYPEAGVVEFTDDGTGTHSFHYAYPYREFIAGMRDAGEISIEGNFIVDSDNKSSLDVLSELHGGSELDCELEFPDGTKWAFDAIATAFETAGNFDDRVTVSATFKVTGQPTLS